MTPIERKAHSFAGRFCLRSNGLRTAAIDLSLVLLDSLHERWTMLMRSMAPEEFLRGMVHPERGRLTLEKTLRLYEWHGRHHTAQITGLRERMDW